MNLLDIEWLRRTLQRFWPMKSLINMLLLLQSSKWTTQIIRRDIKTVARPAIKSYEQNCIYNFFINRRVERKAMCVTDRCRKYIFIWGDWINALRHCSHIMLAKVKMKKEKRPNTCSLHAVFAVLAILGNALFTCKARSDWLVLVPQRLICEGKEVFVEKKSYRPRLFPLHLCDASGKKKIKNKNKTQHFAQTLPIFVLFWGSLCFEHGTYILSCT